MRQITCACGREVVLPTDLTGSILIEGSKTIIIGLRCGCGKHISIRLSYNLAEYFTE